MGVGRRRTPLSLGTRLPARTPPAVGSPAADAGCPPADPGASTPARATAAAASFPTCLSTALPLAQRPPV